MFSAQKLRFDSKVLLDYVSPEGAQVRAVRGSLVVANHKLLKAAGHFDQYLQMLPAEHKDIASSALASSWVSAEHNVMHCQTVDAMQLGEKELHRMGEMLASHLIDSLFATLLRSARSAGTEAGIWLFLKQADRVFARIYQGGGCRVVQTGPKDAVFEMNGMPFADSAVYRVLHLAFVRGAVMMIAKACVVKTVRTRDSLPTTLSVSLSWV
jgi:hypothetical protein